MREIISTALKDDLASYELLTPSKIQEQLEESIKRHLRQKPYKSYSDYDTFSSRLEEMTLNQVEQITTRKTNWDYFKSTFSDRTKLQQKFSQLRPFRNDIGHYKAADDVQKLEGRAAIEWFKKILEL